MIQAIRRWRSAPATGPVAPDHPFVVIGDIHGRDDLLARALAAASPAHVVCVGDYVDRGPDSAGVLRRLAARADITCLMGNHEEMLLRFLEAPTGPAARWLNHGGDRTLTSFAIPLPDKADPRDRTRARDALRDAMGPALIDWLGALPSSWVSGNVAVVHAGADPGRAIADQPEAVLRWGHRDFERRPRRDGVWIVHGHTVVSTPQQAGAVVSIDTGAWASDRLTLARVSRGNVAFETA